jgi:carbon monoxide dehydrogenase subunit G
VRIEAFGVFDASPERTWAVLSDWERQASWMPDVAWIRARGTEWGEGAVLDVRTKVFGIPALTDEVAVTAWQPPHRLAVEHRGVVKGTGEWRLEPFGSGTRFVWVERLRLPFGPFGELALRCYGPIQRAMLRRSVRNLKSLCEASRRRLV